MSAAAPLAGSVDEWLDWQLALHDSEMDLGLDRVAEVARALELLPLTSRAVVIAGTNGKGSCAALIESLLAAAGSVGTYTSPHLWRYNERIRIQGRCVNDGDLCQAFAAVEQARGDTSLTYFEYGTLAALWLFARARVDFAVLEVGLGGRLDAVNIVDADVALITNIGLDHVDWLGTDRDSIGIEKAGVMRAGRPAICADRRMPPAVAREAQRLGARLAVIGADFDIDRENGIWHWRYRKERRQVPTHPAVLPENLAGALCVTRDLGISPADSDIAAACASQARLPGRRERVDGNIPIIYDVGHNAEAVAVLASDMADHPITGQTHLVIGMLADKPVEAVGARLRAVADRFYPAGLDLLSPRGLTATELANRLACDAPIFANPKAALDAARAASRAGDRIVVCGSFLTVAHAGRRCCG